MEYYDIKEWWELVLEAEWWESHQLIVTCTTVRVRKVCSAGLILLLFNDAMWIARNMWNVGLTHTQLGNA